jgi:hypothetical protein
MRLKGKIFFASIIIGSLLVITPGFPSASDVPEIIELDGIGDIYGPVTFDHAMHMDVASCAVCHHHTTGMLSEDQRCLQCHTDSCTSCDVACIKCHSACPGCADKVKESHESHLFHIDTAGLTRAYHIMCVGCHEIMDTVTGCEDCHLKKDESICKE